MRTDPVQLEILIQQFRSITEEMGYACNARATRPSSTKLPISACRW